MIEYMLYIVVAVDADGGFGYIERICSTHDEANDIVQEHNLAREDIYTFVIEPHGLQSSEGWSIYRRKWGE